MKKNVLRYVDGFDNFSKKEKEIKKEKDKNRKENIYDEVPNEHAPLLEK